MHSTHMITRHSTNPIEHRINLVPHPLCISKTALERPIASSRPPDTGKRSLTMEIKGFEPSTYGLQSRRSSQLSYIPSYVCTSSI